MCPVIVFIINIVFSGLRILVKTVLIKQITLSAEEDLEAELEIKKQM